MRRLKLLSAAAALAAILPLGASSTSFAAEWAMGPCTPPAGEAVGVAGPAMNGGQLMAGVGECRPVASSHHIAPAYGYRDSSYFGRDWDAPDYTTDY